jgi:hypothetical protein
VTNDDLLFRHRLLLFAKASQLGVSRACQELGYHRSWYYRWKPLVERHGWRCCDLGSAASRGCPTSCRPGSRSESSVLLWAIQAWDRVASRRNSNNRCGAASWSRQAVCSKSFGATAWGLGPSVWAWSPATPIGHTNSSGRPTPHAGRWDCHQVRTTVRSR